MAYDALNNVTTLTDSMGNKTEFEYTDGAGGPGNKLAKLTDALGHSYSFGYDNHGRLTKTANPLGQSSNYEYDNASRLVYAKDANGNKVALA